MRKELYFRGRGMIGGRAEGEALVSTRAFTFAHGVEPRTGLVTDIRSDLQGKNVRGKVLVFPFGKGSTTGASWYLETVRLGNGPAAILTQKVEPIIVTGAVLAAILYGKAIPVVSELSGGFSSIVKNGDLVSVDAEKQEVRVVTER